MSAAAAARLRPRRPRRIAATRCRTSTSNMVKPVTGTQSTACYRPLRNRRRLCGRRPNLSGSGHQRSSTRQICQTMSGDCWSALSRRKELAGDDASQTCVQWQLQCSSCCKRTACGASSRATTSLRGALCTTSIAAGNATKPGRQLLRLSWRLIDDDKKATQIPGQLSPTTKELCCQTASNRARVTFAIPHAFPARGPNRRRSWRRNLLLHRSRPREA
jgi:hypothetical protein